MQLACTFGPNPRFAKTTDARIADAKERAAERAAREAKKRGTSGGFPSRARRRRKTACRKSGHAQRLDFFPLSYPNPFHE